MDKRAEKYRENMAAKTLINAGVRFNPEDTKEAECPCCKRVQADVGRRRKNSAYADDKLNYLVSCGDCYEECVEYYQDLWDTYYSMVR